MMLELMAVELGGVTLRQTVSSFSWLLFGLFQ